MVIHLNSTFNVAGNISNIYLSYWRTTDDVLFPIHGTPTLDCALRHEFSHGHRRAIEADNIDTCNMHAKRTPAGARSSQTPITHACLSSHGMRFPAPNTLVNRILLCRNVCWQCAQLAMPGMHVAYIFIQELYTNTHTRPCGHSV